MPTASSGKRRAEHYWEGGSFALGCHLLPPSPFLRRGDKPMRLNRPFRKSEIFECGGELASDFRISLIPFDFIQTRFSEEEVDRIIVSC